MDNAAEVTIPDYIYQFYMNAAQNIADCTTEKIMADALSAYAGLISDEILKTRALDFPDQIDEG